MPFFKKLFDLLNRFIFSHKLFRYEKALKSYKWFYEDVFHLLLHFCRRIHHEKGNSKSSFLLAEKIIFIMGSSRADLILKGTVMQIEKAPINDRLRVSKVS